MSVSVFDLSVAFCDENYGKNKYFTNTQIFT